MGDSCTLCANFGTIKAEMESALAHKVRCRQHYNAQWGICDAELGLTRAGAVFSAI
jgi:hypothetical protein